MIEDDDLNRLLGMIVRSSAELDMQVRMLAQQLVMPVGSSASQPQPDLMRIMGIDGKSVRSFEQVLGIVERHSSTDLLADDPTYRRRLQAVVERARSAYVRRNRVVHDPPLSIHPPERVDGGPTHRRVRLDVPTNAVDVDLSELAELVVELRNTGHLCTALWSVINQHRVAQMGYSTLDVETPFMEAWAWLESS